MLTCKNVNLRYPCVALFNILHKDSSLPTFFFASVSVGYYPAFFARPELYDMLYKKIPSNKIHMSKKLVSFDQDEEGVKVYFEDGSVAEGDILVGADGAHSAVRQHLYKTMEQEGLLPESDTKEMSKGYISLVGTTDPLDPAKYPCLSGPKCEVSFVIGDKSTPYTVSCAVAWITMRQKNTSSYYPPT